MANPPTRREPPLDEITLDNLAAEIRERAFDPTTEAIKRTNAMREAQHAHVAAPALDVDHICNSTIADVVEIHLADGRAVFVTGKMLAAIGWVRSC